VIVGSVGVAELVSDEAVVPDEPAATYAPDVGPVCNRILRNGCYLAMRKYSTAEGPELRCTMICE
jgi:hypothetical protein